MIFNNQSEFRPYKNDTACGVNDISHGQRRSRTFGVHVITTDKLAL